MSNLLKKASIVLTPTAYNDGEALCVKPEDGSGDFDFSRNSAATRVNAQGLVENVQILSSNLVQNGDFSEEGAEEVSNGSFSQEGAELVTNGNFDTDSDWTLGSGVNISDGKLNIDFVGAGNTAYQGISFTSGSTSKVVVVCSSYTSGRLDVRVGSNAVSSLIDGVGTYTFYIKEGGYPYINFFTGIGFNGSIDSVSVREVGQDWTFGTGWSVSEDKAVADTTGSTNGCLQVSAITSGKIYKATYEVLDYQSGSVRINLGGAGLTGVGTLVSANGVYTQYITSDGVDVFIQGRSGFIGSVTNISVKEVGQNWTLGSGWSIGDNIANAVDAAFNSQILYSDNVVPNTKYKVSFNVSNYVKGSVRVNIGNVGSDTVSSNGNFTFVLTSANAAPLIIQSWAGGSGTTLSVTNISVIEITTDTNLPRINYEGFSYQDALGSEEIVNGTFDTDSDWTKGTGWSISGGNATSDGSASNLDQSGTFLSGKTYKVVYDVLNYVSGDIRFRFTGTSNENGTLRNTNGTYTEYIKLANNQSVLRFPSSSFNGSIDNVSVKEYLGQEVVPDSGCGSWLWEPQTTQLVPYSEALTSGSWGASVGTTPILESGYSAPDGTNNAFKISNANQDSAWVYSGIVLGTSSRSIYARTVSGTGTAQLLSHNSNTNNTFNITEQWQRFDVNTANSTGNTIFYAVDFRGSGTLSELILWGANATNDQDYATSYIPSNGTSVTRNSDVCTNGGSLASINSTEGVLYAEFSSNANDNASNWINISDGSASNWLFIGRDHTNVRAYIRANNVVIFTNEATPLAVNNKVALSYKSGDIRLYINGVETLNLTNVFSFSSDLNQLNFNSFNGGSTSTQTAWKAVVVYKEALSDEELALLTAPAPVDPVFTLDFDEIANQFTFNRASLGTIVNEQGLIETDIQNNIPRIDYSTGEEAFLLEPQSTNLITQSELFSDSSWVKNGFGNALAPVITSSINISPDGNQNASRLQMDCTSTSSSDYSAIYQQLALDGISDYTISFYVKSNTSSEQDLLFFSNSSFSTQITANSEWQRVESTFTSNSTNTRNFGLVARGNVQQDVDILIWGAQLEQQSYATSYIPTEGTTVTRVGETCVDATPEINSEEGVLYAEISALANDGTNRAISIDDGSLNNSINLFYAGNVSDNSIRALVFSGGGTQASMDFTLNVTDNHKIAIKYKNNDFALWVDGIEVVTDINGNVPVGLNNITFNQGGGTSNFFGKTKDLQYFNEALSDYQLKQLTTI